MQRGQQQVQYRKLTARLADVRRQCRELEQKESEQRVARGRLREEAREAARAHNESAAQAQTAHAAVQQRTHECDELSRQCAWWEQVEEETRAQRVELDDTIAAREREAPLAVAAKERLTREIGERERARNVLQQEVETQRATVSSLQTQLAVQQQRKEHLARAIAQLRAEQQNLLRERGQVESTHSERTGALHALQAELEKTASASQQTATLVEEAEAAREQQQAVLQQLRSQRGALAQTRSDLENRRAARERDLVRAEQVLAGVRQRREDTIVRWLSDEPDVEPVPKPAADPLEELQGRVTSAAESIAANWPREPAGRGRVLRARTARDVPPRADCRSGSRPGRPRRSQAATPAHGFARTLRPLSSGSPPTFATMVKVLFDGGDAELSLTDPHNPDQTGIEITVRLPGKRRQALSLLSGGERALVALALLFALLSARHTPLCLLDEADAMLDETNVVRFCKLLREYGRETQFLIITHNRGTMEMADALFGVSMSEEGVSQVLSLRLEELREQVLSPAG